MLITIIRFLQGYLRIRIVGFSPERFINLCSHHHIYLWDLCPNGRDYETYISVKGFRKLKPIVKKTRTKVIIVEKYGLPFYLHRYRNRKIFFGGAIACVLIIYLLSLFIWNIHIEGNYSRTNEMILEFLEKRDVVHGMRRSKVDCQRIVKDIRKEYDDIVWVSVSVQGSRLMIKVKENTDTIPMHDEFSEEKEVPKDIVAEKAGMIKSMITRSGVPMMEPGMEVKKGDLLVSGRVEVKNDAGEVVNYHYQESDADIEAETTMTYRDSLPKTYTKKRYTGKKRTQVFLWVGDVRFTFGIGKNAFNHSEIHTFMEQIKIGEQFYLPFGYGKKVIMEYENKEKKYTKEETQQILSEKYKLFCIELEKKGVQILENDVKIYTEKNGAVAKGNLRILESIGQKVNTEKTAPPSNVEEEAEGE